MTSLLRRIAEREGIWDEDMRWWKVACRECGDAAAREAGYRPVTINERDEVFCQGGCSVEQVLQGLGLSDAAGQAESVLDVARQDLFDLSAVTTARCLPGAERRLECAKRVLIAAPAKTGKSLSAEVDAIDLILNGSRVAIMDAENGAATYGGRLQDILVARALSDADREKVRAHLDYFWRADFTLSTPRETVAGALGAYDLVIWDSCRTWLTKLGLDEDSSDDFALFLERLVNPSWDAGASHTLLDNTGHDNKRRARGTSAKTDLVDAAFYIEPVRPFDVRRSGEIRLVKHVARSGNLDEAWSMKLGGGAYGSWVSEASDARASVPDETLLTATLSVLADVAGPLGTDALATRLRDRGLKFQTKRLRRALAEWASDPETGIVHTRLGYSLGRVSPDGPTGADGPPAAAPNNSPESGDCGPVPPAGTGQDGGRPGPESGGDHGPPGTDPRDLAAEWFISGCIRELGAVEIEPEGTPGVVAQDSSRSGTA